MTSSSGGIASEVTKYFLKNFGKVASCTFDKGKFIFSVIDNPEDASIFKGSKYVKSNASGIYKAILKLISNGEKILFIGLPCQVASLKNYCGDNDNLYTIDLICHGTPSPQILSLYLRQHGYDLEEVKDIAFRKKSVFQVSQKTNDEYIEIEKKGTMDSYTLSYLHGICYTENCYECQYAKSERVSDITLGDSWGSELEESEQRKGVSLILCQSDKGVRLIENSNLTLLEVDINTAIESNQQLMHPHDKPVLRDRFFEIISEGKSIDYAVKKCLPKLYYKQKIKRFIKWRGGKCD